ncbi:hypothetical protein EV715DRAFT_214945, partial [Schizophyllum commune]
MTRKSDLKGFTIPGLVDKIIVALFADDTTVYLSDEDSFDELTRLLDLWCRASTAKFNVEKTEIIPIGSPEYRASVVETMKISPGQQALPGFIHIARDGEPVRILGARQGNKIPRELIWRPILVDIEQSLERWGKLFLTFDGRQKVLQMVLQGKCQFLIKAQGMPEDTRAHLETVERSFIWAGKSSSPIALATLQDTKSEGGIKVVDLEALIDSIAITNLKEFLNYGPNRPKWAFVSEVVMRFKMRADDRERIPSEFDTMLLNPFIQKWHIVKSKRGQTAHHTIDEMMRVGKKYELRIEVPLPPAQLRKQLPLWMH